MFTIIPPYSVIHNWKMPFENLKHIKPDVTHLRVFGCGAYIFLPEEVRANKLNPKSKLMTFLGYPQGTKGYLFMRGPNNMLFMAVQALFNETLFPKCPDMRHPRYTPVAPPVDAQGEYNIPMEDNENGGHGGVPYQAPLPEPPPKNLGKGRNLAPPVPLEPTPSGPTPSELESDDFYLPRTPSLRSLQADLDSSHGFLNPNPGTSNDPLYDSKTISYAPDGSPSNICYM